MKKRFLSWLLVAVLCLTMLPAQALADVVVVVKPEGGNSIVVVNPEDGNVVVDVTLPDEEEESELPGIGDVITFGGYEWYIIGTETEGVTAPEGCYTLFAKNNDFGSTAYRAGNEGDRFSTLAVLYNGSDLQKAMEEIADDFSGNG